MHFARQPGPSSGNRASPDSEAQGWTKFGDGCHISSAFLARAGLQTRGPSCTRGFAEGFEFFPAGVELGDLRLVLVQLGDESGDFREAFRLEFRVM